jgi:heavy metal sensor kinase
MKGKKFSFYKANLWMFIHSIRFRLVLWFTAILAVILFAFSAFIFFAQSANIQKDAVREINRRMTSLVVNVQSTLDQRSGKITIPSGFLRDTDVFILLNSDGQILASQSPFQVNDVLQVVSAGLQATNQTGQSSAIYWTSSNSQNYIFIITTVQDQLENNLLMVFGAVLDPNALVRRFLLTLVGGSLLTLLIALLGGFWLADRAMRPVKTITQTARLIGETDLNRRLNMKGKDELGELANTFDAMLARLQAAFARQRQFVADASHELRTPLTIVNLETSRIMAGHRTAQEYQHALNIIHSENDFMTSLVNDLLILARMDAGQTTIEKKALDLSDVAVETVERLTPLANRNGVTLEAGNLPETRILGDRQYLLQMVSNLVENAIKYSSGDTRRVCVETGTTDGTAWVRVSDSGPGIAPEHIPHIFDRFYRVDKARSQNNKEESDPRAPSGSGLGLSIVQWIVKGHGGEVHVESTLGVGTIFEARFKAV